MDSNGYLNSSEKLSALIDGELGREETSTLFYELAQDNELQDEMIEQLSLKRMFGNAQMQPPAYLRDNIVKSAGLAAAATTMTAGGTTFLAKMLSSRGLLMSLSALMATLATIFIMNGINSSETTIADIGKPDNSELMASVLNNEPIDVFIPKAPPAPEPIIRYVPVITSAAVLPAEDNSQSEENLTISDEKPQQDIAQELKIPAALTMNNLQILYPSMEQTARQPEVILPASFPSDMFAEKEVKKYTIQIRGFNARSIPELDISPLINPAFNNVGAALFYNFDENWSVGLEFGQEDVFQKYSGEGLTFEQNYLAFWWGIAGQYTFNEAEPLNGIKPFTRVFLGGTRVGPMARGILGLQYTYADRFTILAGLESTALMYKYMNTNYTTGKIGVTYGISVNF